MYNWNIKAILNVEKWISLTVDRICHHRCTTSSWLDICAGPPRVPAGSLVGSRVACTTTRTDGRRPCSRRATGTLQASAVLGSCPCCRRDPCSAGTESWTSKSKRDKSRRSINQSNKIRFNSASARWSRERVQLLTSLTVESDLQEPSTYLAHRYARPLFVLSLLLASFFSNIFFPLIYSRN